MKYSQTYTLSTHGSDRASSYRWVNKTVTRNGKTHVVWTDYVAESRACTFDHATKTWGKVHELGPGADNHNCIALTADADGVLRVTFGPHGPWGTFPDGWPAGNFKYAVASGPNSLDGLEKCGDFRPFGYRGTYACPLHVPLKAGSREGLDVVIYRGGEHPPSLLFQKRRENHEGWDIPTHLMVQDDIAPGYTHYGPEISCDRNNVLYVAGHFYARPNPDIGRSLGVAAIKSADLGETWTDMRGEPIDVPTTFSPRIAVPSAQAKDIPMHGSSVVDSQNRLWVICFQWLGKDRQAPLSVWENNAWRTIDVAPFLPSGRLVSRSLVTVDSKDRIHVILEACDGAAFPAEFVGHIDGGHHSAEIFHLRSTDDGHTFTCQQISPDEPDVANYLPAISKPGPFHPVIDPVILYTHGRPTDKEHPGPAAPATHCRCVFVEQDDD